MSGAADAASQQIGERIHYLRMIPLLADLAEGMLATIAASVEIRRIPAGKPIITKGDLGDTMYLVVAGRAYAHDGDLVFNGLDVGEYFGEMAVLDPEVRSASVTAAEDTTLYVLHRDQVLPVLNQQEQAIHQVIGLLCRRLRSLMSRQFDSFSYIREVSRIAATAQQIEAGVYEFQQLADVCRRDDELGHLARTFVHMAEEVHRREQRLQREVQSLRIEIDQARQARDVSTIVESEYFQQLKQQAQELRDSMRDDG